jgi:hypothetical protein
MADHMMLKMDRSIIENERRRKIWDLNQQIEKVESNVVELE